MRLKTDAWLDSEIVTHFHVTTLDNLFIYTHVPLLPSSIIWHWSKDGDALKLGIGRYRNHRSVVALAVRYRLMEWYSQLRAQWSNAAFTPAQQVARNKLRAS